VRLGRALVADIDGDFTEPILALERDGSLYAAEALDHAFGVALLDRPSDFHARAIAGGGAGLGALDERLRAGDRPSAARLLPDAFTWLAPCDTERALFAELAPHDLPCEEPLHRLGDARALLGHGAVIPFPPGIGGPACELAIAAVLGDEVAHATPLEAERATLGFAILAVWSGARSTATGWESRRAPSQLGPLLVTRDEVADVAGLRAEVRVDGKPRGALRVEGARFGAFESIAWLSRSLDLRAGDVVGLGTLRGGRIEVPFGETVELLVERLGKLSGRPVLASWT
jgi:hypothetical protein